MKALAIELKSRAPISSRPSSYVSYFVSLTLTVTPLNLPSTNVLIFNLGQGQMDLHDDVKTTTFDLLSEWWKLETDIGIHGCHE